MYTQQPIRNYVPKGEEVKLISQSLDGVCLIEYKGQRYPCRIELLGDEPPKSDEVTESDNLNLF